MRNFKKLLDSIIKTNKVQVLAVPTIEIIDKANPKKLEPVSPIKVFAGLKLKGKNPTNEPARAVISKMEIKGEPLSVKIISSEKHDITPIPADKPSNPSIKFTAFVIPTIQIIVIIIKTKSPLIVVLK